MTMIHEWLWLEILSKETKEQEPCDDNEVNETDQWEYMNPILQEWDGNWRRALSKLQEAQCCYFGKQHTFWYCNTGLGCSISSSNDWSEDPTSRNNMAASDNIKSYAQCCEAKFDMRLAYCPQSRVIRCRRGFLLITIQNLFWVYLIIIVLHFSSITSFYDRDFRFYRLGR